MGEPCLRKGLFVMSEIVEKLKSELLYVEEVAEGKGARARLFRA